MIAQRLRGCVAEGRTSDDHILSLEQPFRSQSAIPTGAWLLSEGRSNIKPSSHLGDENTFVLHRTQLSLERLFRGLQFKSFLLQVGYLLLENVLFLHTNACSSVSAAAKSTHRLLRSSQKQREPSSGKMTTFLKRRPNGCTTAYLFCLLATRTVRILFRCQLILQ